MAEHRKPEPLIINGIQDGETLRARLIGIHNDTVAVNTTKDIDWTVPNVSYGGTNKQQVMNGMKLIVKNAEHGDKVSFQVVHPINGVLDEFGTDFYIDPQGEVPLVLYKAKLYAGLIVRLKYTAVNAGSTREVYCNLFRHIDTGIDV